MLVSISFFVFCFGVRVVGRRVLEFARLGFLDVVFFVPSWSVANLRVSGLGIWVREWFKRCLSMSSLHESCHVQEPPDFTKMSVKDHRLEITV